MKPFEIPAHLHATRDLLDGSLKLHPTEAAPTVPMTLVDDLNQRFTRPAAVATARPESWIRRAANFIASPGFGVAAVAAVVLAVAGPAILDRDAAAPSTETFRGGAPVTSTEQSPRIILVGGSPEIVNELQTSGLFEPGSIVATTAATATGNPRIVVNFETGRLTVFDAAGEEVHAADAPTDADALGTAIASALGHL